MGQLIDHTSDCNLHGIIWLNNYLVCKIFIALKLKDVVVITNVQNL